MVVCLDLHQFSWAFFHCDLNNDERFLFFQPPLRQTHMPPGTVYLHRWDAFCSSLTNPSGWWSVKPVNQSCCLVLEWWEEWNPVPITGWGTRSEVILSHVVRMDGWSESPWKFHQRSKITAPNTTFLDFHPGSIYFLGGEMLLRNSCSRTKGKLSYLLEEDLPQGIMSHIGSC